MSSPVVHIVTDPPAPFALGPALPHLEVVCVPAWRDNLVWLVVDHTRHEAAVVDGPDAEGALAACTRVGARLTTVLNTHTHGDHVGINKDLARRGLLAGLRVVGPKKAAADVPGLGEPVAGGDTFELFGARVAVIDTEGHIDGHIALAVGRVLFSGDALFTGGCGRMFAGPATAFQAGLARLRALADDTLVCCAHEYTEDNLHFAAWLTPDDPEVAARAADVAAVRRLGRSAVPSTLGLERRTNPFLRWDDPALLAAVRRAAPEADTSSPAAIFAATRALKDLGRYRA